MRWPRVGMQLGPSARLDHGTESQAGSALPQGTHDAPRQNGMTGETTQMAHEGPPPVSVSSWGTHMRKGQTRNLG